LACGSGVASGLAGPEAEWAARLAGPKSRKRISELKIRFFEFTKALEICRRRFRINFDMRIFSKYNMTCHAMHPIQDLFLESFSYVLQFDMHSYVDKKNYSSKKWVLQLIYP
jgi:hypothetical protein